MVADLAWGLAAALVTSMVVNALLIRFAGALGTLDRPVARSSHDMPRPTLGGLGIVGGFWTGLAALAILEVGPLPPTDELVALGTAVALLLLFVRDDVGPPLGVGQKATLQVLAAATWLYGGFGLDSIHLPLLGTIGLGALGGVAAGLLMVGLCNVYNFMDGMDGLVAVHTLVVGCLITYLFFHVGSSWWIVTAVLVAATAGFCLYNRPPARIFSGDVGAMFLGFMVAVAALHGEQVGVPVWVIGLLLAYFLFDTGYTLVRRALNGENVLLAHRKHLYQRLGHLGWSHGRVLVAVTALTLLPGVGGVVMLLHHRFAGLTAIAAGAILVAATTLWIEARDRTFD